MLYEPQLAPQLPDLMLLDEEEPCSWPRLASFAPSAPSAPVPIAAPRAPRCEPPPAAGSLGSDLVDSLESTQTLLGASLAQEAAGSAAQPIMRFVPVEPPPPPPRPLYPQPQPRAAAAAPQHSLGGCDWLYGGYGVIAEPQAHPHEQHEERGSGWAPYGSSVASGMEYEVAEQPASYGWGLPPAQPAPAAHTSRPYAAQLGEQLPASAHGSGYSSRGRVHLSAEALQLGNYRGTYPRAHHPACGPVASLDAEGSEGSDEDTLGEHLTAAPLHHGHASATSLALPRPAGSGRRAGAPASGPRSLLAASASPRTICLKVKGSRPRPAGALAAAHTAGEDGRLPARYAARRSMALSTAALAEEAAFGSDSEPELSGGSAGRRSGGGSSGAAAAVAAAAAQAGGKKKHNPWSLAETEALVDGVRLLGPSKWAEIKKLQVGGIAELLAQRSAVDLKDKWRNLTRVAKLPRSVLKVRAHKSTSDIPLHMLLTVKDLMEASRE